MDKAAPLALPRARAAGEAATKMLTTKSRQLAGPPDWILLTAPLNGAPLYNTPL